MQCDVVVAFRLVSYYVLWLKPGASSLWQSGLRYSCYYIVYGLQESPSATVMNATQLKYDVVSTVTDRSILNDEMASMCAKFPIYLIKMTITQRKSSLSTKLQSDVYLRCMLRIKEVNRGVIVEKSCTKNVALR